MLFLVFNLTYPQVASATIYQPGETLTPDCAPETPNCGVATFSLNGQATSTQTFATGISGTDFNIVSGLGIHTFNFPSASALNRGLLIASDWSIFNGKQTALGFTPVSNLITVNGQALTGNITLSTADILDSLNKRYVTDAQLTVLGNTSGTNTGDVAIGTGNGLSLSGQALSIALSSASATGTLSSLDWITFNSKQSALGYTPLNPANNLSDLGNASTARTNLGLGSLATQSGTFSGTSSGTNTGDQTTVSGNAGTASALQTARTINGVSFDGTANITVTAAAGTLTGTTLASGVTAASLTSIGTLSSLVLSGAITGATGYNGLVITPNTGAITTGIWNGTTIAVANGGTGSTNGSITGTGALSFISDTTNALTLESGTTGAINIGTNANAKTITIGNGTGATSLVLNAGTGNIDIGANAVARTINVGTGSAVVETINIGGTGANVIGIGNTQTGGSVNIGAAMTTGTITIGGTGAQTGTITIDGGTGTQTINLGTGAGIKTVNVGSTDTSSRTNINAGTGGYFLTTNLGTQTNGKRTVCFDTTTFQLFKGASAGSCDTSSSRYKHDIENISLGLDVITALRPVSYAYNSDNEKSLGFIAEEVALVDDRLVVYNDGIIDAINTDRFIPILTRGIQEVAVLIGDISPKVNADGSDNGLSTLIVTIQAENARDPVAIITAKIAGGKQFLTDFVVARVTAIRGYFDEVFAKKIHTEQICVKKSDGSEVCVNGDQLNSLLQNTSVTPAVNQSPNNNPAPTDNPEPTSSSTSPVVVEPTPTPTQTSTDTPPTPPEVTPIVAEPTPIPVEVIVTPEPTPPAAEAGATQ